MFATKHSKTNRLQKNIEYKINEQSTWLVFAVLFLRICTKLALDSVKQNG